MLYFVLTLCFLSGFAFILGFFALQWESRPTLQAFGYEPPKATKKVKFSIIRVIAMINKPFCQGPLRVRMTKDLLVGHVAITPEEFFLAKEVLIIAILVLTFPMIKPDMITFWLMMSFVFGYMLPEYWLKGKIKRIKTVISNAGYRADDVPANEIAFKKLPGCCQTEGACSKTETTNKH